MNIGISEIMNWFKEAIKAGYGMLQPWISRLGPVGQVAVCLGGLFLVFKLVELLLLRVLLWTGLALGLGFGVVLGMKWINDRNKTNQA